MVAVTESDQPTVALLNAQQRLDSLEMQFADVRPLLQGARVFGELGGHRCVIKASAVRLPSIGMEIGDWSWYRRVLVRRSPFQCRVRAMIVEVSPEIEQLVFEIRSRPEQRAIQVLTPNRADQAFHKGMRPRNIGNGFYLGHLSSIRRLACHCPNR